MSLAAAWLTATEGHVSCDYLVSEASRHLAAAYSRLSAERASAVDLVAILNAQDRIGERSERFTTVIVTDSLQHAAAAPTTFVLDGELVEHGPPAGAGAFTNPKEKLPLRDVTEGFG